MTKAPIKSRLAGFVASKGQAERPVDQSQRPPAAIQAPIQARSDPSITQKGGMGVKSLTLRLPESEYERLREFAFKHRTTHQDILSEALKAYLDQRG